MVVFNSLFGVSLRLLNFFPIIYDLKELVFFLKYYNKFRLYYDYLQTCSVDEVCQTIEMTAKMFYLFSLSGNFFFFYRFDHLFYKSFRRIFLEKKNLKNEKKNNIQH